LNYLLKFESILCLCYLGVIGASLAENCAGLRLAQ